MTDICLYVLQINVTPWGPPKLIFFTLNDTLSMMQRLLSENITYKEVRDGKKQVLGK